MAVNLKGKSFLSLADFTAEEIRYLLDLSRDLKAKKRAGICSPILSGKNIVLIFEKTSTRTRCAFEVAAHDEGAHVTYLDPSGSQMGKKESLEDTAKVLGRFYDGIEYRGFEQSVVETLAKHSGVPVFNGLTDDDHPTQILADMLTIEEHIDKPLNKVKLVFAGDVRNNMCIAWMHGAAKMGMELVGFGPRSYSDSLDQKLLAGVSAAARVSGARISFSDSPSCVENADVIYTDIWASMGEEEKIEARAKELTPFRVDEKLMAATKNPQTIFMHCLPAFHDEATNLAKAFAERGIDIREVSDAVFHSPQSVVFDEAENRMHTIKAVLAATMG